MCPHPKGGGALGVPCSSHSSWNGTTSSCQAPNQKEDQSSGAPLPGTHSSLRLSCFGTVRWVCGLCCFSLAANAGEERPGRTCAPCRGTCHGRSRRCRAHQSGAPCGRVAHHTHTQTHRRSLAHKSDRTDDAAERVTWVNDGAAAGWRRSHSLALPWNPRPDAKRATRRAERSIVRDELFIFCRDCGSGAA